MENVDVELFRERVSAPDFRLPIDLPYVITGRKTMLKLVVAMTELPSFPFAEQEFIEKILSGSKRMRRGSLQQHLNYLGNPKVGILEKPNEDNPNWRVAASLIEKVLDENGSGNGDTNEACIIKPSEPVAEPTEPIETITVLESLSEHARMVWKYFLRKSNLKSGQREIKLHCESYDLHERAFAELKEQGIENCRAFQKAICQLDSTGVISTTLCRDGSLIVELHPEKLTQLAPPKKTIEEKTVTDKGEVEAEEASIAEMTEEESAEVSPEPITAPANNPVTDSGIGVEEVAGKPAEPEQTESEQSKRLLETIEMLREKSVECGRIIAEKKETYDKTVSEMKKALLELGREFRKDMKELTARQNSFDSAIGDLIQLMEEFK